MNLNELIDRFVKIAFDSGVMISSIESAPWIDELEQRLQKRFPASFRSLVTRYKFPRFEIGGIAFFANTGMKDDDDMAIAIYRDPVIAQLTQAKGFIQFARPADGFGWYDPICFDTNKRAQNREYPIVQIDHEQILSFNCIGRPEKKADSFYKFVVDVIKASDEK
jgi:hypothetical protein